MKIVYFFTFDYTLKTWLESGSLDRELEYFDYLNKKYGLSFILVTYGDKSDNQIINNMNFIEVIPIYEYTKRSNSKILRYINSFKIPFTLKNKIRNFDVIKQNQLLGSWVAILFKFISKKPLITRTGYDMYSFSIYEKKNLFIRILYFLLTQISLTLSNIYSVTSIVDKIFLEKRFLVKNNKINLIPNWINNHIFNDFNKRYENKILGIGRFENQKNFTHLVKSFKNSNVEIDLYGEGSLKSELKKLAEENNVKVNFLGVLPYSELQEVYSKYKIFVSTSFFEGNPKTILEAMSFGCVVVASNIKNNNELIKNNVSGVIFDFEDNLKEVVEGLFQNKDEATSIGLNSQKTVINNNNIDKIAELDVRDYKKLAR